MPCPNPLLCWCLPGNPIKALFRLEFIPDLQIDVVVFIELAELTPCFAAAEDVCSERDPDMVGEVVFDLWVQEIVAI
jgi:hypothetical protein